MKVQDLFDEETLNERIDVILPQKNAILEKVYGEKTYSKEEILEYCKKYKEILGEYVCFDWQNLVREFRNKKILFEGAQGAMLDIDSGTYPYVSSGASCSAGAATGCGIGPHDLDKILGVFKAYETRVGNGPMPTEFNDSDEAESELCRKVRDTGREYGVTTGRARRCGYLDLVALRYACRVNSIDSLVLTHLDIYDPMEQIEACIAYDINGKIVTDFPANVEDMENAKPVLQKFTGWKKSLKEIRKYSKLPKEAREYVEFIEDYCKTPVGIISVGYERDETFIRKNPWKK